MGEKGCHQHPQIQPQLVPAMLEGLGGVLLWQVCRLWCQMLVSMIGWRIVWALHHGLARYAVRNCRQVLTCDGRGHCSGCLGHLDRDRSGSHLEDKIGFQGTPVSSSDSGCMANDLASSHA